MPERLSALVQEQLEGQRITSVHWNWPLFRGPWLRGPLLRGSALAAAVGLAYFLAAQMSLGLLIKPDGVAVFWPAAGISSGVLIALGPKARWPVALGAIAAGIANDLLTRAADVCLKERRPLVLCLRETPLNRIHLENMVRVHDAGATVMPAMPAFYYAPKTIDDIVEQFTFRVLAQLGLAQEKQYRWKGGKA